MNQNFALPNDMRDMLVRLQHLIDKACKDGVKLSAEDFAGCVHGFMLVRLSWLPTRVSEDGHVYVDHTQLQSTLDQIINRLLCV